MSRVSYVMMNEGGADQLTDAVRAGARRARRRAARRGRRPAARSGARRRARRQPDHAPPRARHRSDAARHGAVHAGHRRRGRPVGRRPRARPALRARSTPVRASPATSAPTRPRPCSPRARTAATAMQLLVDVGTNAEIVLGNRERLLAASSPTGPAFEGAQISCGQRATAGAIESVRIDPDTLRARIKVIGVDVVERRAGLRRRQSRRRASPACAGPGSSTLLAEMFLAGVIRRRRHDRRRRGRTRGADRSSPTAARSAYVFCARRRRRAVASRRTTSAPSSSPRPRCDAGIELLLEHAGDPTVDRHPAGRRVRQPHRPATRDGARARPRLPARRRALGRQRRRRRRGDRAAVGGGPRPRWSASCATIVKIETAIEPRFQELFVARDGDSRTASAPVTDSSREHADREGGPDRDHRDADRQSQGPRETRTTRRRPGGAPGDARARARTARRRRSSPAALKPFEVVSDEVLD